MSTKDAIALLDQELKDDFNRSGSSLMYVSETNELIALTLDSSSFVAGHFYIVLYWMPLYAPTNHLVFNFGTRLRHSNNSELWSLEDVQNDDSRLSLIQAAKKWKQSISKRRVRCAYLRAEHRKGFPYAGRALFYDFAMHHQFQKATRVLRTMSARTIRKDWHKALIEEMSTCVTFFADPQQLDKHLTSTVQQNRSTLSIPIPLARDS